MRRNGLSTEVDRCHDGTICCWIGHKKADKVILWFHGQSIHRQYEFSALCSMHTGGGYARHAILQHFEILDHLVKISGGTGGKVAALIPQYGKLLTMFALFD